MGWLLKKVSNRMEEKLPGSADAIEQMKSDATTGESHAFVVSADGHLTQVESQQAVQDDLADQLSRLGELHDRGALTDAEYEAQKRQISGA
ncbi:MAG TPA: SHOCT domain-containing protein [Acidimicrobiia bacterium]